MTEAFLFDQQFNRVPERKTNITPLCLLLFLLYFKENNLRLFLLSFKIRRKSFVYQECCESG